MDFFLSPALLRGLCTSSEGSDKEFHFASLDLLDRLTTLQWIPFPIKPRDPASVTQVSFPPTLVPSSSVLDSFTSTQMMSDVKRAFIRNTCKVGSCSNESPSRERGIQDSLPSPRAVSSMKSSVWPG